MARGLKMLMRSRTLCDSIEAWREESSTGSTHVEKRNKFLLGLANM
jgi:hypothetical protein